MDKMRKQIERSIFENQRCFTCGSLVYFVEKKMTTKHLYHDRCFQCRICKRSLNGLSLNEDGDDIYCTNCYRKKQKGDCDSAAFRRAATEKAELTYLSRHPNLPIPFAVTRFLNNGRLSRQPSRTLRRIELEYRSDEKKNSISKDQPKSTPKQVPTLYNSRFKPRDIVNIPISFVEPNSASPLFSGYQSSTSLHFSPVPPSALDLPRKSSLSSIRSNEASRLPIRKSSTDSDIPTMKKRVSFDSQASKSNDTKNVKTGSRLPEENRKFVFPNLKLTPLRRHRSSITFNRVAPLPKIVEY